MENTAEFPITISTPLHKPQFSWALRVIHLRSANPSSLLYHLHVVSVIWWLKIQDPQGGGGLGSHVERTLPGKTPRYGYPSPLFTDL